MTGLSPVFAVVPAAGSGRRMAASLPKQYLTLAGRTVLEHTLLRLLSVPGLQRLVLTVSATDLRWQSCTLVSDPRVEVVTGGEERCHSVLAGLEALAPRVAEADWVLVHDVARPCVPLSDIERLRSDLANDPIGGLLALPLTDTLKRAESGRVAETLDRSQIWRALTPQMFRFKILRDALRQAVDDGVWVTDEAAAIERAGHSPRLIEGQTCNLKITRPEDLALAAYYLEQEHPS